MAAYFFSISLETSVLKCRGMSGIAFKADPSIFTVLRYDVIWPPFWISVKISQNQIKICFLECPGPSEHESGFVFFVRRTTSGLAAILFFSKNWSKYKTSRESEKNIFCHYRSDNIKFSVDFDHSVTALRRPSSSAPKNKMAARPEVVCHMEK